ncbi:Ppx/GppA phosphatase family protein, partial [Burkholderia cenocepacia]|uniref:Ppx/GppA phosphatase family protein n=1 Tax=Burkholderia cenocepacia TaxID=95486 RepID=UPI003F4A0BAF
GGGSTEFIIGSHYTPIVMESLYIGCVSHSRTFFPAGNVDEYTMRQAELAAKREIQIISSEVQEGRLGPGDRLVRHRARARGTRRGERLQRSGHHARHFARRARAA